MKYTIKNFRADFPSDAACLAHIFKSRYPNGLKCPKCGKRAFYAVGKRRSYVCACGFQTYPTEGTIFHKSPTPLTLWFHAIFLMSQSKNGVSAKELERQLGVTYKCAWRIAKQIRSLMKGNGNPLSGVVEVDETWIGGRVKGKGKGPRKGDKAIVQGELQRGGALKLQVVPDNTSASLMAGVTRNIDPSAKVMTDEHQAYRPLGAMGYDHATVCHLAKEYARGAVHTNSIEGFWSQLKRSINGTYHAISRKHLPSYLDEFSFRYEHRQNPSLPVLMLSRVGMRA